MSIGEIIGRARQVQVNKVVGVIIVVAVVVALSLAAFFIYGPSTPSQSQIQSEQARLGEAFAKLGKAETERKQKEAASAHRPFSIGQQPAKGNAKP